MRAVSSMAAAAAQLTVVSKPACTSAYIHALMCFFLPAGWCFCLPVCASIWLAVCVRARARTVHLG
jgi:hypothetical protein